MNNAQGNPAMPENNQCPECGRPLKGNALAGLCPACLLGQGARGDTVMAGPQPFVPPSPGELAAFFPQFEVLELIGRGGMGAVYKARQKQLDRIVALKILPPGIGNDPAFAERFTREARALAKLNHPGIVTIHDFGMAQSDSPESPKLYFFSMEFVDGVTLRQLLNTSRVSPREALAIVPQICDALQFAHDHGIVHRDVKPENILLDRRGRVKVADFGLVKLMGGIAGEGNTGLESPVNWQAGKPALHITEADKVMGTPNYMAPEQKDNPTDVDHRADIYALGVVFYQLLTGELPGKQIEPPSRKVQIDVRLDEIVLRALEKNPELRYDQASELKTQVESFATRANPGSRIQESLSSSSVGTGKSAETSGRERIPLSLKIVAILFFVVGCSTAWQVISGIPDQVYSFNLGVLGVPIAVGLLRQRPRWRHAAIAGLGLSALTSLAAIVMAFLGRFPAVGTGVYFGHEVTPLAAIVLARSVLLISLMLVGWMFWVLFRPDVKALFHKRGSNRPWLEWAAMLGVILIMSIPVGLQQLSGTSANLENSSGSVTNNPAYPKPNTTRVLSGAPYIAELPDGGRIELLAVRTHPSKDKTWWAPDGSVSSYASDITMEGEDNVGKGIVALARVKHPKAKEFSDDTRVEIGTNRRFAFQGDRRFPIDELSILTFEQGIPTGNETTLSIKVAAAPWTTLSRQKPGKLTGLFSSVGRKHWSFEETSEGYLKVKIGQVLMNSDMTYQLLAEDKNGKLHSPAMTSTTRNSGAVSAQYEASFVGNSKDWKGLPFNEVKEVRWDARPYDFVEFRNVSLQPGYLTKISVKDFAEASVVQAKDITNEVRIKIPPFGEVMERTVFDDGAGRDFFFDFETGKSFTPPRDLNPRNADAYETWIRTNGIDVAGETSASVRGLVGIHILARPAVAAQWDAITPETLVSDQAFRNVVRGSSVFLTAKAELPETFLFSTREGAYGILQITGFVEEPRGVNIRYKMVEGIKNVSVGSATGRKAVSITKVEAMATNNGFGQIIERSLPAVAAPDFLWFDLDTDKPVSLRDVPEGKEDVAIEEIMRQRGIDVGASPENRGLMARGGGFIAVPVIQSYWRTATVETVSTFLLQVEPQESLNVLQAPTTVPVTFAFRTREGSTGLLQITGLPKDRKSVMIRYKMAQNVPTPGASLESQATDAFHEYAVNKTWEKLTQSTNENSPEFIQALLAKQLMQGDPATALNHFTWDLPRVPVGSVKITMTDGDKARARESVATDVIVFQQTLAAVISLQRKDSGEQQFITHVLARRNGQWKRLVDVDLIEVEKEADAKRAFRAKAPQILEAFQKLPEERPDIGKAIAATMGQVTGALLDVVGQISTNMATQAVIQVPQVIQFAEQTTRSLHEAIESSNIPKSQGGTNAAPTVAEGSRGLEFRWVASLSDTNTPADELPDPTEGEPLRVEKSVAMGGDSVAKASVEKDPRGKPRLRVVFTPAGKTRFAEITRKNIGRQLAIVYNGRLVAAPKLHSEITDGVAMISGRFSEAEAEAIVRQLNNKEAR